MCFADAIDAAGIPLDDLAALVEAALAERAAAYERIGDIGLRGVTDPVTLCRALIRDSSPAG